MNFSLTSDQAKQIAEFHPECKKKYTGAIGGGDSYTFSPNSIGWKVVYTCKCGETLDVTDYDNW